jgi:hypothetical protein
VYLIFREGDFSTMLFSFEECSNDPLSEGVSLGSFLDAVQEGGPPVGGWGFGEQVEVIG